MSQATERQRTERQVPLRQVTDPIVFSPRRVGAMVLRYWYLLRSSWARLVELS